jgi:membrane protease YdiL (CAAX protease family)
MPSTGHAHGMTNPTTSPAPTARSSWAGLRPRIAAHPVATQLIALFGIAWPVLIPVVLTGLPVEPFLLVVVVFGQLLPAVVIAAAQGGRAGVKALFGRIFRWRVPIRWYLAAFLLIPLSCLAVSTIYGLGNWTTLFTDPNVILTYLTSLTILPIVNLWEETAWTDTVQHNLARRRGPLFAAIITGPLFGLLHLPLRLSHGINKEMIIDLAFTMLLAIGLRILIGWLYYSTGRSILIAAITHATFNATNNGDLLLHAAPDSVILHNLTFFVVAALAVVVAVATRGRLGAPKNSPANRVSLPAQQLTV